MPKGLFEDEASPVAVFFATEPVADDLFSNVRKQLGRDRHVKQKVCGYIVLCGDLGKHLLQVFEKLLIVIKIASRIEGPVAEPFEQIAVGVLAGKLLEILVHLVAELFGRHFLAPDPDDCEILRKELFASKIIESRKKLAFGQIAGCTEDDH